MKAFGEIKFENHHPVYFNIAGRGQNDIELKRDRYAEMARKVYNAGEMTESTLHWNKKSTAIGYLIAKRNGGFTGSTTTQQESKNYLVDA